MEHPVAMLTNVSIFTIVVAGVWTSSHPNKGPFYTVLGFDPRDRAQLTIWRIVNECERTNIDGMFSRWGRSRGDSRAPF
jgi:hypothetical protein